MMSGMQMMLEMAAPMKEMEQESLLPVTLHPRRKTQTMSEGISTAPEMTVLTKMSPDREPVFKDIA